jgi:hypothetical protein
VYGKPETTYPNNKSGYHQLCNGFLKEIEFYNEPHGFHYQNPQHLGSASHVDMEHEYCDRCFDGGAKFTSMNIY